MISYITAKIKVKIGGGNQVRLEEEIRYKE
jgi:hypothetical protein